MWYGSGAYIVDGKKIKISISTINKWPIEKIRKIKEAYEMWIGKADRSYFEKNISDFIRVNKDRYNDINAEAIHYTRL